MKIMKKVAPIALALSLAAGALFGNPLESTIIKEDSSSIIDLKGSIDNKSFSFDSSLSLGNDWELDFASDMQYSDSPRINNADGVIGNKNFYAGFSYGDLSTETLLQDSDIMKVQAGLRPFDWLDFSMTGAKINMPNTSVDFSALGYGKFETPLTLYAIGWNADLGEKFDFKSFSFFPWLSVIGSKYYADPQETQDFINLIGTSEYDSGSMAYPFDHLNVKGGLELGTKYFDLSYMGTFDGQFYNPSPFNLTNMIGASLHDESRKASLECDISLITKPNYSIDEFIAPTRNELQFDVSAFALFKNGFYLKGKASELMDFLAPDQFTVVAGIGEKFNGGNLEFYYNSQNNVFGIQYSTQLDTSMNRESRLRNNFHNSTVNANPPYLHYPDSPDLAALHAQFGDTLEEAISKIHSEQDLSRLISCISQKDHDGTFSAQEEYEIYGYGVCRDINGNLSPYIESRAFNYKNVYAVGLRGPFIAHAVVVIETQQGKFNLRNYADYYILNAPTAQAAVDSVFPGDYIYGDGTVSSSVSSVRTAVESPIYDWAKFR